MATGRTLPTTHHPLLTFIRHFVEMCVAMCVGVAPIGRLTRLAIDGDAEAVLAGLRQEGFIRPDLDIDADRVLSYLRPMLEPLAHDHFQFSREWMRAQAARIADPRNEAAQVGRQLNLPPSYLLIHRVTLGSIGVLCQLDADAPYRGIVERWQPGFANP